MTVDVVAAAGEDGGDDEDDADDGDDGATWAGDSSGIELQPVPRRNGSTALEDDDEIQWKPIRGNHHHHYHHHLRWRRQKRQL